MPTVVLTINGSSVDLNLPTGGAITLDASGSTGTGTLNYLWEILSKPSASAAVLSANNIVNPTFTPDVAGSYLFSCKVTDDIGYAVGTVLGAVLTTNRGLRTPAVGEENQAQVTRGWEGAIEDIVESLDLVDVPTRRGSGSITSPATTLTVDLTTEPGGAEVDANYDVFVELDADNAGFWISAKTVSGFTVNVNPAGAGNYTVAWKLARWW